MSPFFRDRTTSPIGHLLIVDTDSMSAELLQMRLVAEGYNCKFLRDGQQALALDLSEFSLIIVDLMDCRFNGLQFITEAKRNPRSRFVPIIMLSAPSSDDLIVDSLDAGAEDFVAKPFSTRLLIARIRSVIRRNEMVQTRRAPSVVRYNNLELDLASGSASIAEANLKLTRTEFTILAMFLRNRGSYFERGEIIHEAWEDATDVSDRAVDTNISRLRKKLGLYGKNIVNRQGYGYGFIE